MMIRCRDDNRVQLRAIEHLAIVLIDRTSLGLTSREFRQWLFQLALGFARIRNILERAIAERDDTSRLGHIRDQVLASDSGADYANAKSLVCAKYTRRS